MGIFQARILEWVAVSFSRGSSWPRFWTHISWVCCIKSWIFYPASPGKPLCVCVSSSVMSDSLWPHGLQPAKLLCPWDFPGKNTGVGCHFFLQRIFLTWGWTWVSCITDRFFNARATRDPGKPIQLINPYAEGKKSLQMFILVVNTVNSKKVNAPA